MTCAGNVAGRFAFQPFRNETVKQAMLARNIILNNAETTSLKDMASSVLLRNSAGNKLETTPNSNISPVITPETNSPLNHEAFIECAAIIESYGVPREWAEGFATLCTMPRPAAYASERWKHLVDDGGRFLDAWGRQAAALGWRAVDVFGVNPDAPESRYDGMGLVPLLNGSRVKAITADTARVENSDGTGLTFYRRRQAQDAIALWDLEISSLEKSKG